MGCIAPTVCVTDGVCDGSSVADADLSIDVMFIDVMSIGVMVIGWSAVPTCIAAIANAAMTIVIVVSVR